jgi:hypothetical protein
MKPVKQVKRLPKCPGKTPDLGFSCIPVGIIVKLLSSRSRAKYLDRTRHGGMIAFVAVVALVIWYAAGSRNREEQAYQDRIKKQQHYDKIHAPCQGLKTNLPG